MLRMGANQLHQGATEILDLLLILQSLKKGNEVAAMADIAGKADLVLLGRDQRQTMGLQARHVSRRVGVMVRETGETFDTQQRQQSL